MWNLLMGNSTSSDEIVQEDNTDSDDNHHTQNKCEADRNETYSNNSHIAENTGVIESNIMRIGSYHQPLKVTKIENKHAKKQEDILHDERVHTGRNRLKMADISSGNNASNKNVPSSTSRNIYADQNNNQSFMLSNSFIIVSIFSKSSTV